MIDELSLFTGKVTVSELSDEHCRETLRRIVKRYSHALGQLEAQYRQEKSRTPEIEILNNEDS